MTDKSNQDSTRVCALNDALRRFQRGGRIMITSGIRALGAAGVARVLTAVAQFDAFTGDNDPYGEHDCAILAVDGLRVLFKIDLYEEAGVKSDNGRPETTRVLTIMLAEEW